MLSSFTFLFDACVLYPAPVRDIIIELAISGFYRAKWTNEIHEEWIFNLLNKRPDLTKDQLERTRDRINESVPDCLVEDYDALIPTFSLPDNGDRHILAAAIKSKAQIIVTYNIKDFPIETLNRFHIESQHLDDFFLNQNDLNQPDFLAAIKRIRDSLKKPSKTAAEYLFTLRKHSLPKTAEYLETYIDLI